MSYGLLICGEASFVIAAVLGSIEIGVILTADVYVDDIGNVVVVLVVRLV